jgi:uncharacterized membrane protein
MQGEKKYWLDRSVNVTRLYRGLWGVGLLLLALDLLLHRHETFEFAAWFGFYGIFGFIAIVVLIFAAKALRRAVMRSEDYYER